MVAAIAFESVNKLLAISQSSKQAAPAVTSTSGNDINLIAADTSIYWATA